MGVYTPPSSASATVGNDGFFAHGDVMVYHHDAKYMLSARLLGECTILACGDGRPTRPYPLEKFVFESWPAGVVSCPVWPGWLIAVSA